MTQGQVRERSAAQIISGAADGVEGIVGESIERY